MSTHTSFDGLPSCDENNISNLQSNTRQHVRPPVKIKINKRLQGQKIFTDRNLRSRDTQLQIKGKQSISEFLDGMPSYNGRNFSCFKSNNVHEHVPVFLSSNEGPPAQKIVPDKKQQAAKKKLKEKLQQELTSLEVKLIQTLHQLLTVQKRYEEVDG